MKKQVEQNWTKIEKGYNISIPLNAPSINVSSPSLNISLPDNNFATVSANVVESGQRINPQSIDKTTKFDGYITISLINITEIGNTWDPTDQNITIKVNLTFFVDSPYLNIGNDTDIEWEYYGEFNSTVIVNESKNEIVQELNEYISNFEGAGYVSVPLTLYSHSAGNVSISSMAIDYRILPRVYTNTIQENDCGAYSSNSVANIVNNNIDKQSLYGIRLIDTSFIEIENNNLTNNKHGIYCNNSSPVLVNNIITNSTRDGVACFVNSEPEIYSTNINNNTGSGICIQNSNLSISNSNIKDNNFAIFCENSTLVIENCNVSDNDKDSLITFNSVPTFKGKNLGYEEIVIINSTSVSAENLTQERDIHIKVINETNWTPVNNTLVTVNDYYPGLAYQGYTDSNGYIEDIDIADYVGVPYSENVSGSYLTSSDLSTMPYLQTYFKIEGGLCKMEQDYGFNKIYQDNWSYSNHSIVINQNFIALEGYNDVNSDISILANHSNQNNPAIFAIDGDSSTNWSADGSLNNFSLKIDFNRAHKIEYITIRYKESNETSSFQNQSFSLMGLSQSSNQWESVTETAQVRNTTQSTVGNFLIEDVMAIEFNTNWIDWVAGIDPHIYEFGVDSSSRSARTTSNAFQNTEFGKELFLYYPDSNGDNLIFALGMYGTLTSDYEAVDDVYGMVSSDYDGDGNDELFACVKEKNAGSVDDGNVIIYGLSSSYTISQSKTLINGANGVYSEHMCVGDFDGDDDDELVLEYNDGLTCELRIYGLDETLNSDGECDLLLDDIYDIVIGDYDGDGDDEIYASVKRPGDPAYHDGNIFVYDFQRDQNQQDSDGNHKYWIYEKVQLCWGANQQIPKYMCTGDFDSNDDDELIMTYDYGSRYKIWVLGTNSPTSGIQSTYYGKIPTDSNDDNSNDPEILEVYGLAIGDFDDDLNDDDEIFANIYPSTGGTFIYVLNAQSSLGYRKSIDNIATLLSAISQDKCEHMVTGDFDDNGDDELALEFDYRQDPNARQTSSLWGLGFGSNNLIGGSLEINEIEAILVGDYDGDGDDEVYACVNTNYAYGYDFTKASDGTSGTPDEMDNPLFHPYPGDNDDPEYFCIGDFDVIVGSDVKDQDNDYALLNFEEKYGTDPLDPDTDQDYVRDGLEILFKFDPLDPNDGDKWLIDSGISNTNWLEKYLEFAYVWGELDYKGVYYKSDGTPYAFNGRPYSYYDSNYDMDGKDGNDKICYGGILAFKEASFLESLSVMYSLTGNSYFLDILIRHVDLILKYSGRVKHEKDLNNNGDIEAGEWYKTWGFLPYGYDREADFNKPTVMIEFNTIDGRIGYAIAKGVYQIVDNPQLWGTNYYTEEYYLNKAAGYFKFIRENIIKKWCSDFNHWNEAEKQLEWCGLPECPEPSGQEQGHNGVLPIARILLESYGINRQMYSRGLSSTWRSKINEGWTNFDDNTNGNTISYYDYKYRSEKMFNHFADDFLKDGSGTPSNYYWVCPPNNRMEDIGHGNYIACIIEGFHNGVITNTKLDDINDMKKIKNTLLYKMWDSTTPSSAPEFKMNTDGTGGWYYGGFPCKYHLWNWILLSEFDDNTDTADITILAENVYKDIDPKRPDLSVYPRMLCVHNLLAIANIYKCHKRGW